MTIKTQSQEIKQKGTGTVWALSAEPGREVACQKSLRIQHHDTQNTPILWECSQGLTADKS